MQKLLHKFGLHVLILQLCKKLRNKKNLAGAVEGYVRYTLKKLSELMEIDAQELDKITTDNFNRLFFNT